MLFLYRKVRILFLLISLFLVTFNGHLSAQGFSLKAPEKSLGAKKTIKLSNQCLSIDTFVLNGAPGLKFDTTLDEYFIDCNDSYEDNCNCCVSVPPASIDDVQVPHQLGASSLWRIHGITRNIACNLNHLSGIPISTRFVVAFCHC